MSVATAPPHLKKRLHLTNQMFVWINNKQFPYANILILTEREKKTFWVPFTYYLLYYTLSLPASLKNVFSVFQHDCNLLCFYYFACDNILTVVWNPHHHSRCLLPATQLWSTPNSKREELCQKNKKKYFMKRFHCMMMMMPSQWCLYWIGKSIEMCLKLPLFISSFLARDLL